MPPAIKVAKFESSADVHQDQGKSQIRNQAELCKDLLGEEGRQVDQAGKGRTDQQAYHQVAGDSRDMAERSQPAAQQSADENRSKRDQYVEQRRVHNLCARSVRLWRSGETINHVSPA